MLSLNKASFAYDRLSPKIIENCSVEFNSPGVYLIVGENASGKSTFMDMMCGFKRPVSGKIKINNVDLYSSNKSIYSLRRIMSYMPASLRLPLYLEVSYLLNLWKGSFYKQELINELGLKPFLHRKYFSLSDGYRNRVNLAIAMARGSIVLLDEPLKSQDDELKKLFPKLITNYSAGRTFIVTSPNKVDGINWNKSFILSRGVLNEA